MTRPQSRCETRHDKDRATALDVPEVINAIRKLTQTHMHLKFAGGKRSGPLRAVRDGPEVTLYFIYTVDRESEYLVRIAPLLAEGIKRKLREQQLCETQANAYLRRMELQQKMARERIRPATG